VGTTSAGAAPSSRAQFLSKPLDFDLLKANGNNYPPAQARGFDRARRKRPVSNRA
jgi:hypothetical protein